MQYTKEQQNAINTIKDNLQIIACAGSGKTQVISQRIVNILKDDKEIIPKNIIAFTYTEKAAAELKTRVLKLCREQLGDIKGLAEMYIGTIHSWCLQAIQDNIFHFQKYSILDEIKQKLFVDKYYNIIGMASVGMDRYKDTGRFLGILAVLREAELNEGIQLPAEWKEAVESYESLLHQHSYFDFTMIMSEVLKNLNTDKSFRERLYENLKYLVVDEYQDVNPIQEQLIVELSKSNCNVCVVGDDDQTLYEWRLSDVKYIQQFKERYKDVSYIKLEDNFRSSKGIIDSALKCISHNALRLEKVMNAKGHQRYQDADIIYNQYEELDDENQFIADTVKKLRGKKFKDKEDSIPRGIDYSDCAILLRTWRKANSIIDKLTEENIPFVVGGVNNLFQRPEIRAARAIYQYLNNDIEADTLLAYWEAVTANIKREALLAAIDNLDKKRPRAKMYFSTFNIQEIFWNFIEEANLFEETFAEKDHEGIVGNEINEVIFYNLGMFSQIINDFESIHFKDKPIYKLSRFLNFLRYSADGYYPEGWLNNSYKKPNAVQIMTIFQAKGLEFPVVFVPGLNKNYLPIKKPGGKQIWHFIEREWIKDQERLEGSIEAERRLFYVAITRSQKYLFLTRSVENRLYQHESVFAREISHSDYIISDKNPDYSHLENLTPKPKADTGAIQLNFSVLKAFFDCPYRFKILSLYGFVFPISEQMGYGNSIHNVLMEIHRRHLNGENVLELNIGKLVDSHVHIPYATEKVLEDIKETTNKVATTYLQENYEEFDRIEYAEQEIQIDLGDGILVNGRMDLIKKLDLDGNEITTIIDFKSKKESQDQDITMEQLSMYALGYKELTGKTADRLQIYNLDESKNSKHTQRLENSRIEEIKERIISSANEIRDNNLEKSCAPTACVSCWVKPLCSGIKTN
ncbi:DNA helicase-2 / ATP-dependent DNA helicase PcrA [Muriicola jejuensis]|uniref:DNA 3'-5' helicase n=1 Tax=Muriicola jejuensis TaxID=504488 RepID=A0A6P0U9R3_9FLAO|nr:ATP-dependent DNA helicase [Muriicola jejuensis]NER10041.1 UvrD-helicase domain-containing protein [Muriicola jejuensis]SMP03496.1 DNA helicase-2 / ATP-dependent DNA helicase PcrA [Muriicola jejuensis]